MMRYKSKEKNINMRLQVDNDFQQLKIKDLNDQCNIKMFTINVKYRESICCETKNMHT